MNENETCTQAQRETQIPAHLVLKPAQGDVLLLPPDADIPLHPIIENLSRPHKPQLKESIEKYGQLTPGVIVEVDGRPFIAFGATRRLLCRELGIDFLYVPAELPANFRTVAEWIWAEYEASRHSRNLTRAQAALDAAHLCRTTLAPQALARQLKGKKLSATDQIGPSYKLAAETTGVKPNAVRDALKIIGTPIETLVAEGRIPMSVATRFGSLDADVKSSIGKLARKGEATAIIEILRATTKRVDGNNREVPEELANTFDRSAKLQVFERQLNQMEEWLSDVENASLLSPALFDKVSHIKNEFRSRQPFICSWCSGKGCDTCNDEGWLTKPDLDESERVAEELMRTRKQMTSDQE